MQNPVTVIDLGCKDYGSPDMSRDRLVERFDPQVFYGFDPLLAEPSIADEGGCRTTLDTFAAWTFEGTIRLSDSHTGLDSTALHASERWRADGPMVRCFYFSHWLQGRRDILIVKMDIEGAEFPVLRKMREDETDKLVDRLLISWHDHFLPPAYRDFRGELTDTLECEVEEWS